MGRALQSRLYALPVHCSRCGEMLDLQFDEGFLAEDNIIEMLKERLSKISSFVCWRCRDR